MPEGHTTNTASDFTQFSVTAPLDSRLPGGGGFVVPNLYNINPNVATAQNNVTVLASDYGSETNTFNGMLLNVSARPRGGLVFQGGLSTGKTSCAMARPPVPIHKSTDSSPASFIARFRFSSGAP